MQPALVELWALQQIDSAIHDLERDLAKLDTGAEAVKKRDAAKERHDAAVKRLHIVDAEVIDVDLNLKSTEAKRKDFENRMYSGKVTAPKELDAMSHEIEMLKRNRDKLETRELELMDEQSAAHQEETAARAALEESQKILDTVLASFAEQKKTLESELAAIRKTRDPQTAKMTEVDFSLLRKYENLRTKIGYNAVCKVEGLKCSVCNVQVPDHALKEVKAGDAMVTCESCGRILVI